jgi:hypothetical protein
MADAATGLKEAAASGADLEVWVNPQESGSAVLEELLGIRGKARILLLWNARNAGYLLTRQSADHRTPDLLLDIGVERAAGSVKRVSWGHQVNDRDLAIPLPRSLWTHGRSHPTGAPTVSNGTVDLDALKAAAGLL